MLERLRPHYSENFRCIGSECEDTCCHGMDVIIDKAAYEKYQSTTQLHPVLQHLVLISEQPTPKKYARIQLTSSYNCPFLSVERLCSIQQEHGATYLADVCANFPRVKRSIDDLEETVLLLSCPEAARLVLLDPKLALGAECGQSSGSPYDQLICAETADRPEDGTAHRYLWEIRSLSVAVLRDRSYPLWQRMFVLGMFCKRFDELITNSLMRNVPRLIADFAKMMSQGLLKDSLNGMTVQLGPQLATLAQLLDRHYKLQGSDPSHQRFRQCIQDFLSGVGHKSQSSLESCEEAYRAAHQGHFSTFMGERPHILENYLINHIFKSRFPFGVNPQGEPNTPQADYLVMCLQFGMVKGLLIGIAGHYKNAFAEAHVVKLIQSFAKAVEHHPEFLAPCNLGLSNEDAMAILLRN